MPTFKPAAYFARVMPESAFGFIALSASSLFDVIVQDEDGQEVILEVESDDLEAYNLAMRA